MKKEQEKISLFNLVMLGLGSLIGSGWLFGSWEAAKVAGPAAILSWIVGAAVIGIIAYNYIELGTMLPESGGMSKYAQYTHGSLLGFIASWANWISLVTIIPIEAVAAVQYMGTWPWKWAHFTSQFVEHGTITSTGLLMVFAFIIIFTLFNYWSVSLLTRFTSLISVFKVGIPLLTIIMLGLSSFYPGNFGTSLSSFMPYGSAAIFKATTVSGIIFSFNAFQTVINLGSEIQKPRKNIKRGIILSLLISSIIYILLQATFITSISPHMIAEHGWSGINFESPFADLAILLGIHWLSVLLYMDAFVSPFGTGVSFVASTGRALAAMVDNKHLPKILGKVNQKFGIPRIAIVTNSIISMLMVSVFRSWGTLASVVSTATLIAYLTGPVTVISFRKMAPNFTRPVRNSRLRFMAPFAFTLSSLAIYWAMWPTTFEVILIILLGLPLYLYYELKNDWTRTKKQFFSSLWMIFYLVFLTIISYVGSKEFNGLGLIKYPYDFIVIIFVSLGFYYWGTESRLFTKYFKQAQRVNDKVIKPSKTE
ncbi:APC family permease [Liquorilactobacillus uvarum]|uniref:APC family permease n=1 Tax=Liquorilactobacillus uvarum TaxID=303240 RepID=UPI00288C041A|nr:APC family permease [Liquorilactobacillus uvarum]